MTIRVTLEGDAALMRKLARMGVGVADVLERAVTAAAEIVRDDARTRAPGPEIQAETAKRTKSRVQVDVGPDKEHWYYRFLETGAAAHAITGQPLAFMGDEGMVFTAQVNHPGIAPQPFLRPAMDSRQGDATREMGAQWRQEIEAAA